MEAIERDSGLCTEKQVREYFESRPGWTVEKLDAGKTAGRAPDFCICHGENCFLCEVKTIASVRADVPYGPVQDYRVDERDKVANQLDGLVGAYPDRHVIVPRERYEWLHESETELRKRYSHSRRNTEAKFREFFHRPLLQYFGACSVSHLPYDLRVDSDDLYVPSQAEMHRLLHWLEKEIADIDQGNAVDYRWVREGHPHATATYSVHYPLHKPVDEHDTRHILSLRIHRRGGGDDGEGLKLHVYWYGTLNVERVRSNVEQAIGQLRAVAKREERASGLPRVVVLRFVSGPHPPDWQLLDGELRALLTENQDLSAIAVLDWRPDGDAPPDEQGIRAWFRFLEQTPWVPFFVVYHNDGPLDSTDCLHPEAFRDRWSTHVWVGPQ